MSKKPFSLLSGILVLAVLAPAIRAQSDAPAPSKKELTEATSEGFGKLRPLIDAKDYDGAVALIEDLLSRAGAASFDRCLLSQIQAQILLTQGKPTAAVAPLETALRLAEENPAFHEPSAHLEQLHLLAQIFYQQGAESPDPALQRTSYEKALARIRRWFDLTPRVTAESRLFAASLLYQLGTLDPANIDAARLREAMSQAREGLLLAVNPPAQLTLVLVGCHLQLGEHGPAAELLETLALRDPDSASTWSQLQSIYLARAADAGKPEEARAQNLRALSVLDRAQALGRLNSPKDHYTRVAILFNLQQYTRAAALLEKGLADGMIENTRRNWELLASAYQQTNRETEALDALQRAVARFPEDPALEFGLAQSHYGAGRVEPAYRHASSALEKGFEKRGQAQVFLAYLAYELQRYDDAARWIAAARETGEVPAANVDPLDRAITDALAARQSPKRTAG
jgi:predicted Zn-dependent protease